MKKMGRRHRPFFRVVAVDRRAARDGKVIEYLGNYDPLVTETDARATLKNDRIDYWLSVGAQPSDRVRVLIKKYGTNGTHLEQRQAAMERLQASKPSAPPPVAIPKPKAEEPAATEEAAADEAAPDTAAVADEPQAEAAETAEATAAATETAAAPEAPAEEAPAAASGESEASANEAEKKPTEENKE